MKSELERCQETLNMTRRAMKDQYKELNDTIEVLKQDLQEAFDEIKHLNDDVHVTYLEALKYKKKYIDEKYTLIGFGTLKEP